MYKVEYKLELAHRYNQGESSWQICRSVKNKPTRQTLLTWCRQIGIQIRHSDTQKTASELKDRYHCIYQ